MKIDLDIIIPVYLEQDNILETLAGITKEIKILSINYRILIIYDFDNDPTISIIKKNSLDSNILLIKNRYSNFNGAIKTAYEHLQASAAIVYTAEDHNNFKTINEMFLKYKEGFDVVCASRFIDGIDYYSSSEPLIKKSLVRLSSVLIKKFTDINCDDPTNGFRLFSNEIIRTIPIRSKKGFTFAIELLFKSFYNSYKITQVAAKSPIRKYGKSKFKSSTILFYIPWFLLLLFFGLKKKILSRFR